MKITLDITKSIEENAAVYFDQAKKAKKKIEGAKKALEISRKKLLTVEEDLRKRKEQQKLVKDKRKKSWFEKFRWFYTSDNFFFIAGRDATTNEIIIKKHTDKEDLVFHSEMAGSPFGVLKTNGKEASKEAIQECADFIGSYSRAWKSGITVTKVFYVNPDQVTKEAPSGEFIGKGSFMIYGKKNLIESILKIFIGKMKDEKVMSGPENAVKKHCKVSVEIIQGTDKTSAIAKQIKKKIEADDLDDIVKVIPVGSKLKK